MASPLASLYTNSSGITQLVYPSDLGSTKRGHWMTFTISVPQKSIYNSVQVPLALTSTIGAFTNQSGNITASLADSILNNVISSNANNAPQAINASSITESRNYTVMPGTTKINTVIALYTPNTISVAQHAHYGADSITDAMGAGGQVYEGVKSMDDVAKSGFGTLRTLAEEVISQTLGNEVIKAAALKGSGNAINPQMEVFFKDIDFRTFQFDFLFTPKSEKEAKTVNAIIQAFKFHAAPEIDQSVSGGSGRFYIVPSIFEIQMYKDGQPNLNVNKYGVCACETVNVDYAPQGWVTHDDGMPVQTRLTLQFKEMEIMTKDKITLGY